MSTVGHHPQRLEPGVVGQHPQTIGADRDRGHRVGVVCVGLAVVAGVEQPRPGAELGRHVDHVLPVGEQSLRQRPAGATAAFDRPDPVRPGRNVLAHRGVARLVGIEPTRCQDLLASIDDLDGRGQFVGIDPDEHLCHPTPPLWLDFRDARRALLLRAG
jgi:hypothetical protein